MDSMSIIYVRPSEDPCSCKCCYARNYDSTYSMFGERVDTLYEVQIGCTVTARCKNCLKNLYEAVGDIVNTNDTMEI